MSYFNTWLLLASALLSPEQYSINKHVSWHAVQKEQKFLVHNLPQLERDLDKYYQDELTSLTSIDHEELNSLARKHDIPITFNPFQAGEFGSLSILDLKLNWLHIPEKSSITFLNSQNKSTHVEGLLFKQDFEIFYSKKHTHPIIKIQTHTGDYVCLTIADKSLCHQALSEQIKKLRKSMKLIKRSHYDALLIPQFRYEGFVNISWVNGLYCASKHEKKYAIRNAVEYLKLLCDEQGCSVKAGAGLEFYPISNLNILSINRPFYFWLERSGSKFPIMEAYVERDLLIQK